MTRNINRYKEDKTSFFSVGTLIKNLIITMIMTIPMFVSDDIGLVIFMFCVFFITALIADAIRKYTKPNVIMTRGGALNILKSKLYWNFGPQIKAISFLYLIILILWMSAINKENSKETNSQTQIIEKTPTPQKVNKTIENPQAETTENQYYRD